MLRSEALARTGVAGSMSSSRSRPHGSPILVFVTSVTITQSDLLMSGEIRDVLLFSMNILYCSDTPGT